jgi:ABC-type sugar transport system ATPase subunit
MRQSHPAPPNVGEATHHFHQMVRLSTTAPFFRDGHERNSRTKCSRWRPTQLAHQMLHSPTAAPFIRDGDGRMLRAKWSRWWETSSPIDLASAAGESVAFSRGSRRSGTCASLNGQNTRTSHRLVANGRAPDCTRLTVTKRLTRTRVARYLCICTRIGRTR